MPRFFLDPSAWHESAALTGEEAKHCARVMRAQPGDRIVVFDGEGRSSNAEVLEVSKDRVTLRLGEVLIEPEPKVRVVLAQAVLKGKAMDWLLQKATELGVDALQPLTCQHAVAQPGEGKEEKWQRAVLEACKQCGRSRVPSVLPSCSIDDFLERGFDGPCFVASLQKGVPPLRDVLGSTVESSAVTFLVGPEGDFSDSEYARMADAGVRPASLGQAVLRSETAAVFCLAAAQYALG